VIPWILLSDVVVKKTYLKSQSCAPVCLLAQATIGVGLPVHNQEHTNKIEIPFNQIASVPYWAGRSGATGSSVCADVLLLKARKAAIPATTATPPPT
jgi:hypothetical protein